MGVLRRIIIVLAARDDLARVRAGAVRGALVLVGVLRLLPDARVLGHVHAVVRWGLLSRGAACTRQDVRGLVDVVRGRGLCREGVAGAGVGARARARAGAIGVGVGEDVVVLRHGVVGL